MRLFRFISFVLVVGLLSISTAHAQSSRTASAAVQSSSVDQDDTEQTPSSVVLNRTDQQAASSLRSREDVETAMLDNVAAFNAQTPTAEEVSFDLPGSSAPANPLQAESDSNRRLYYIIGGVLVAGGLAAGILALSDDDDAAGIPIPPGRP